MKKCVGFAQIPVMITMLMMAIALPVLSQMVKNGQDTRNRAQSIIIDPIIPDDPILTETPMPEETPPMPEENYYLCSARDHENRICDSNRVYLGKQQCEIQNNVDSQLGLSCVKSCRDDCLNTYSVCIPPELLKKCPNGFRTHTEECAKIFNSKDVPRGEMTGINYYYADEPYRLSAQCASFSYDFELSHGAGGALGELECYERFGKQNCFISNGDCKGMCPSSLPNTITPAPPFEAYRCMDGKCQKQVYVNIDKCFEENGFAGCLNGCSDQYCSLEQASDYYYCDYSEAIEGSSFTTGKCGGSNFKNIYECYSKYEKCTLLNCLDNPISGQGDCVKSNFEIPIDKKLKLYFCTQSGSRWEIFSSWKECGKKAPQGVCYDSYWQSKALDRCSVLKPDSFFYYLDKSYTRYGDQCRKGDFAFLEDCELYINGCDAGTTLDYCKKLQGENFKNLKCFVDDNLCGRPEQELLTIEVTPKFSSNPVRAKEEFSLDIYADVLNEGKTMPDFSIKLCMDGDLLRVLNKDNSSDCNFSVENLGDGEKKCYQVNGSCVNKSGKTMLARLWFMANKPNTSSNFSIDWLGYFANEFSLTIGSEVRSCETGENGDANKNGEVKMDDFSVWEDEYFRKTAMRSDFNCDGQINLVDFEIWRSGYFNKKVSITPVPRPLECTKGQWKCLDNTRALVCMDGFWKNTICGSGYKCNTGVCEEVKCVFKDEKYSIGSRICSDTYLPSTCMSNGLFENGDWCKSGDWCKDGECVDITCKFGDEEYKVGESYCGIQSLFKCGSGGNFYSYACNGTLVPGEKTCQCVPFENSPTPTPPAGTPVIKCYRVDTGGEMKVNDHYCENGVFNLCQETGLIYKHTCVNGCMGDECATEI